MAGARVPYCPACRHFRVSWDPRFPRACTVFGIKSRELPSLEVLRATGRACPVFEESPRIRRERGPRARTGGE
ncbi:hypothetical protein [Spirochaeta thermophila]|uniref:hypothetical protein n=1 Tax=Winmispira thermophila TaxID=154 RepID=UPI0005A11CB8|nr:hypothetical protein [Spirochaeta thermophila]